MKTYMGRLGVIAIAAIGALMASGSAIAQDAAAAGGKIIVSTFPFGVEDFQKAVVDPFTAATGITVELDTGSNSARLSKLQLANGNPGVDVVLMSDTYVALGQELQLFEQLDAEDVPAMSEIMAAAADPAYAGPAYTFQLDGTIYKTDKVTAEQAAEWSLYEDPAMAGRVALPDVSAAAGQLVIAGLGQAYGSGPYDGDAAITKLAEWSPNILQFYTSSTEVTNLLTQGEIYAANALSTFAINLNKSDASFAFAQPSVGAFITTNRAVIPTGAPNEDGAKQFINYLLGAEAQAASAAAVGDLPVNTSVAPSDDALRVLGDAAKDPIAAGYATLDPKQVVAGRDELVERFTREVVGQ